MGMLVLKPLVIVPTKSDVELNSEFTRLPVGGSP